MDKAINVGLLHQKWIYHPEEDTDTEKVYRPEDPSGLSRNRMAFDFRRDGTLIRENIGADDKPGESKGLWKLMGNNTIALYSDNGAEPAEKLQISSLGPDKMTLKK